MPIRLPFRITPLRLWCLLGILAFGSGPLRAGPRATVSLAGEWRFAMDRGDVGVKEHWFTRTLADHIHLPGILQAQGYGNPISVRTPWVMSLYDWFWYERAEYAAYTKPGHVKVPFLCQPPRHYLGAAWYQREIDIPAGWRGRRVALHLERPHWKSTVWLDDREIGSRDSLVAPHDYDLGRLEPGRHRLTIRVDNRMILPYRPDAHSVSDSLGAAWNGIVGAIDLEATSPVWIADAQVFPDVATKSALIKVRVGNDTGAAGAGTLSAGGVSTKVTWTAAGGSAELDVPLGPNAQTWDEFHPVLQHLTLRLAGAGGAANDQRRLTFGLRDFKAVGTQFILNGHPIYLRGTHFGGDFPLTGYPPTDVAYWRRLFLLCRSWGLNHMRFHSWCPPAAAFTAADEVGFYLQPEAGMWNSFSPGSPMDKRLYAETDRMLKAYGNHPSFMLLSPSNEPHGNWVPVLTKWVEHFNQVDPRRLYTSGTGWPPIRRPGPVHGADYLVAAGIGRYPLRGPRGWFGHNFAAALKGVNVPVVAHEVGQWCAYPDYDIIPKFTGYLRPGNFEIFRDSLAAHHLLPWDRAFAQASGHFQVECYKEEIEANLRTPGLDGFQLLDLHDYVGQGTALVGLLDTFWQQKGYVTPAEFRQFCNTVVPLAVLAKRVFTTADKLDVPVEVANYGRGPLTDAQPEWRILDAGGGVAAKGSWPARTIPLGKNIPLGKITCDLSRLKAPGAYQLEVTLAGTPFRNTWNIWLYPAHVSVAIPASVIVTRSWAAAKAALAGGGRVLFLPHRAQLGWTSPPLARVPIFWDRQMNPRWSRMLGLLVEAHHPALAEFPTQTWCDWQWTQLVGDARAINLDHLPQGLHPIVWAIDDWNRNWKLGVVFECRVGPGRLVVCSADLTSDLANRPVARQLRRSLLDYMAGNEFHPRTAVPAATLDGLWFDSRIMHQLGATVQAEGFHPGAVIDGNPETAWVHRGPLPAFERHHGIVWLDGRSPQEIKAPPYRPCALTITFPRPVPMRGLRLMPRQNDRMHRGDIRGYRVDVSDDGTHWREVAHGDLKSTFEPQEIRFGRIVTARHVRLTALSGFDVDTSTALAELAVMYAGPKLPDGAPEEKPMRGEHSTTPEVNEDPGAAGPAGVQPAPGSR